VIVDAGIKIVETAGSNPAPHLPMFHDNGIKVLGMRQTHRSNRAAL
jgi:nitronate monooxygenase